MKITAVRHGELLRLPWETDGRQETFRRQNCNDIFGEPLTPFLPACSGGSFRLLLNYELISRFYSGRDRAGREKKSGETNQSVPNNHLCRDWISGIPIARAGGWKRLFRRLWPDKDTETVLFGPADPEETADEDDICKGELKFHHALFPLADVGTALIAPRNETTGAIGSTGPITYEVLEKGGCCCLVVDYLPRVPDPGTAALILDKLIDTAKWVDEDAIGGKSSIWGRIKLVSCRIAAGPDLSITPDTDCERS